MSNSCFEDIKKSHIDLKHAEVELEYQMKRWFGIKGILQNSLVIKVTHENVILKSYFKIPNSILYYFQKFFGLSLSMKKRTCVDNISELTYEYSRGKSVLYEYWFK